MDILDDTGVSKLSAKVFSKVNYSFKVTKKSKQTILFFLCVEYCSIYYKWFICAHLYLLV